MSSNRPTTATVTTTASEAPVPHADGDRDNDVGAASDDTTHASTLDFGHGATSVQRRAITALVKRYYATALAESGARGCALLYSTLAEAAPEDDSREPGTPVYLKGQTTCAGVLRALFHHYHAVLDAELPKLQVWRVRVEGLEAFAYLRFGGLPERRIGVKRERHVWKISQISDQEMP